MAYKNEITPSRMILKEEGLVYDLCKWALFIFFLSDACNKILLYFQFDFNRVGILFRAIYEVFFFAIILLYLNRARLTFLGLLISVFILFIVGQILFAGRLGGDYNYLENILIFNKYFFVFIIYYAIYKIEDERRFQRIIFFLERIFLINSLFIIVGLILKIGVFRTYLDQTYRYGYSGFIPAQNEATLFYILAISYFYHKKFVLGLRSKIFWVVLIASLFVGTKGIYIFIVLLVFYHFLRNTSIRQKLATFLFVTSSLLILNYFLKTEIARELLSYFIIRLEKGGIIDMLLSGRLSALVDKSTHIFNNWSFVNYLIGGQDQTRFAIEMDFLDIFFFLGILGGSLYFSLFFFTLFRLQQGNQFQFFFIASYFLLAFFGGHFFFSTTNVLYTCLFSIHLIKSQRINLS